MEREVSGDEGKIIPNLRIFSVNDGNFVGITYFRQLLKSWKIITLTMEI